MWCSRPRGSRLDLIAHSCLTSIRWGLVVDYAASGWRVREIFARRMELIAGGWPRPKKNPVILVANRGSKIVSHHFGQTDLTPLVVQWNGEQDDEALRTPLETARPV
jgi:hypothetical protein